MRTDSYFDLNHGAGLKIRGPSRLEPPPPLCIEEAVLELKLRTTVEDGVEVWEKIKGLTSVSVKELLQSLEGNTNARDAFQRLEKLKDLSEIKLSLVKARQSGVIKQNSLWTGQEEIHWEQTDLSFENDARKYCTIALEGANSTTLKRTMFILIPEWETKTSIRKMGYPEFIAHIRTSSN